MSDTLEAPQTDPWQQAAASRQAAAPEADPWKQAAAKQPSAPTGSAPDDPWQQALSQRNTTFQPQQPTQESSKADPNAPWYSKAWQWSNTPLVDDKSIENFTGWKPNFGDGVMGGLGRGVLNLAEGLTSPLSVAFMIGTLGTGGLIESGASSVLRTAGLAADEIAEVGKGSQIMADVLKAGKSADEGWSAIAQAGLNPQKINQGFEALSKSGLTRESILRTSLARTAGSSMLRQVGMTAAHAEKAASTVSALIDGGFAAQNVYGAAIASPRVLDALKEEDYGTAAQLITEAAGGAGFGLLGAHAAFKEAGQMMSDAAAASGLRVKPSETTAQLMREFDAGKRERVETSRGHKLWEEDIRERYKPSQDRLARIMSYVEHGDDENEMARTHNALAESAGVSNRLPATNPQPAPNTPEAAAWHNEALRLAKTKLGAQAQIGDVLQEAARIQKEGPEVPRIRELIDRHLVRDSEHYNTPSKLEKLLDSHDPTKLTDEDRQIAREVRDKFSDTLDRATKANALSDRGGLADYVTHIWEKDANNEAANRLLGDADGGAFSVNTAMARKRIFDHVVEGQLLGKKLAVTDPIGLAGFNAATFDRIIADRKTLERIRDLGVKEDGGRPMLALEGRGTLIENEGENPAVIVRPNQMSSIRIADKVIQGLKQTGSFEKLVKDGSIVKFGEGEKEHYAWSTSDYQDIDHSAFRGWKMPTTDSAGNPVLLNSRLRVHPRAAEYLKTQLEGPSDIATNPILNRAAKVGAEAKGILLFGSPFHLFQEGLRAVMTGISPFGTDKWDVRSDPTLAKGIEHGLTMPEYKSRADFSEGVAGHSDLIKKIPGLSQIQDKFQSFLFEQYIPTLKARAFKSLYARYAALGTKKGWSETKIAEEAAADTNSRFGGINWKREGRSAATQDIFRLAALAPDWLESEIRFMGRAFGSSGEIARKDLARMALYMWGTARVLNYLVSGKPHHEAPFGVAIKGDDGREKVYSMRSLPSDMLHAVSDPTGFLKGRRSPLINSGVEAMTGRDTMGRKLPTHNLILDVLSNVSPIPVQSAIKTVRGETPDLSSTDQIVKGLGGTAVVYRTEAQKLAAVMASDKNESGPLDPSKLRRHLATLKFTDDVRSGAMPLSALHNLVETGHLSVTEGKEIVKTAEETKGMPPDDARLYTRASRLGLPDFLKIWEAGTAGEKSRLAPLLLKKKQAYLKKANKDMAPQERLADPTYQWVRKNFPQEPPW